MSSSNLLKSNSKRKKTKSTSQTDDNKESQLKNKNIRAIERIDSFVEDIVTQSANSAIFEFNVEEKKWQKSDIDGTLFIYRRMDFPLYSLMVANRQSPNDFIHPITPALKLKYVPPHIFMYKPDGMIKSLWIYGEDECKRIYETLVSLRQKSSDSTKTN